MTPTILRRIRRLAFILIFGLAGFYFAAYLREPIPEVDPAPGGNQAQALVQELPDFQLSDSFGQMRSIREWSGRPLLINFWATWCAPCLREMPLLQALQDERGERFQVIGIAVDRLPAVQSFVVEAGVSYPILVGQQDAMDAAELFGPEFLALPFSIFIAADGRVLGLRAGELDPAELRELLDTVDAVGEGRLEVAEARVLIGES